MFIVITKENCLGYILSLFCEISVDFSGLNNWLFNVIFFSFFCGIDFWINIFFSPFPGNWFFYIDVLFVSFSFLSLIFGELFRYVFIMLGYWNIFEYLECIWNFNYEWCLSREYEFRVCFVDFFFLGECFREFL